MRGLRSLSPWIRPVVGHLPAALLPRRFKSLLAIAFAVLTLVSVASVEARSRGHHHGRSSAAAAAARKKQTIQKIQSQVAIARQVLAAAESKASMSAQELNAVKATLDAARSEMETAGSEEKQAREELREIEANILEDQGPESPLGKAQAAVDEAQKSLDRELHRVVTLPEHGDMPTAADRSAEARSLSADDKQALRTDAQYRAAQASLESAKQDFARTRRSLLEADLKWVRVSKAVAETHDKESQKKREGNTAAAKFSSAGRNLRTAQDVAAAARVTIANGEAMLRKLGVKQVGGTSHTAQATPAKPTK